MTLEAVMSMSQSSKSPWFLKPIEWVFLAALYALFVLTHNGHEPEPTSEDQMDEFM